MAVLYILASCCLGAFNPVVVAVQADEAVLVARATALQAALVKDTRLEVLPELLVPEQPALAEQLDLLFLEDLYERARDDYAQLDCEPALTKLTKLEEICRLNLNKPAAKAILARALRLQGLVHLFLGQAPKAAASFGQAGFLDPDFSPPAEDWPPEARLAYADAQAIGQNEVLGALSIEVTPKAARIWLDGYDLGIGPKTSAEIHPGEHYLLATCPGYNSFAALVTVQGQGRLNQTTIFLTPMSEKPARPALFGLLENSNTPAENIFSKQVLMLSKAETLIMVGKASSSNADSYKAWLYDNSGKRKEFLLEAAESAAAQIAFYLLGPAKAEVPAPKSAWYLSYPVWVAAAAGVIGGSLALYFLLRPDAAEVSLYIEGPQR